MDYSKVVYELLYLYSYRDYQHVCNLDVDNPMTPSEGQVLFEEGILDALRSKESFLDSTKQAKESLNHFDIVNPESSIALFIIRYPCAYSVSCILLYLANKLGLYSVESLFKDTFSVESIRTANVEKKLRQLGFLYFLKRDYVAARGAIGTTWPRNGSHHARHMFFITKDGQKRTEFPNPNNSWDDQQGNCEVFNNGSKWQIKDLGAENLHFFDHIYMQSESTYTEGFWLPPGIYPLRRE